MANTYFKIINKNLKEKYTDSLIEGIQKDLVNQSKFLDNDIENLFSMTDRKSNALNTLDINTLLKCYLLNQILKDKDNHSNEPQLVVTANPNIKKNPKNNKFYRIQNDEAVEANDIESVNPDGSYVVIEKRQTSCYKVKKVFDKDDNLKTIQLIDRNNNLESDSALVAEFFGLKKIFTYKYKYTGYSGISSDFVTALLNKFAAPLETRYYMDRYFNYYEWSKSDLAFVRNVKAEISSPLMVDYEFPPNGTVLRKEYTGIR